MNILNVLTVGDTFAWTDSLADYPAPTWTLKYVLYRYGQAAFVIAASASGTNHAISEAKATTAAIAAGIWNWTAYVEDLTTRKTIATGTVTIKPNVSVATSAVDFRSHAQKVLDSIEAVLEGRASHAELSLAVNGKQIQYLKPDELVQWRNVYRREVAREKGVSTTIRYTFGRG